LARRENHIHVSGRSLGKINVQLILEKLGGGGHLEVAGGQLQTLDMDEAKNMLMEQIDKYKKESKLK